MKRYKIELIDYHHLIMRDTKTRVERDYNDWNPIGKKKTKTVGKVIISVYLGIMPYCCGIIEVGGVWIEKKIEREGMTAFCKGLMEELYKKNTGVAVTVFIQRGKEEIQNKQLMDCLTKEFEWKPMFEPFINRKYRLDENCRHMLYSFCYRFPEITKTTKSRRVNRG
ncbi:MAG: hypothetical protein ACREAE_02595 [Nitrosopumilaceae archaeon]